MSAVIARSIVQDIVERDLPPGTMLPAESLAAERLDPVILAELRGLVDQTKEELQDEFSYRRGIIDFHRIVVGASGNRILDMFGRSLLEIYTERVQGAAFPREHRRRVQVEHEAITRAVEHGEVRKAQRLTQAHMNEVVTHVTERHPGLLDEVVDWR